MPGNQKIGIASHLLFLLFDHLLNHITTNMRKAISYITKGRSDVVNYGYLEGTVVEDARKEGVVVYEYNVYAVLYWIIYTAVFYIC